MAIIDTLKTMGIDEKQAQVYLACLELGKGTIQEVSLKSGVKRTSIYNFLEEMKNKGLVSEIKEGKKVVLVAEDPNNLSLRLQRQSEEFKQSLPELMSIFNLPSHKPKVKFYQGVEGIKNAYSDLLTAQGSIYGFADYEKMFYLMDSLSIWRIPEERAKRKIKYFNIAKDSHTARDVQKKDDEQLRETRLVKDVEFETEINIYDNKVTMMSFRRPGAAVIIEDAAIAQTLRSIWKAWWKTLPNG
ncbi:MAG: helix-turn-helix domain-containing protein [Candidatus Magasanikbacteria bacterium]